MEDRCPGCLGTSTEISQPLDSETLPWLAIAATQPWTPTSSHPGTCHTELNSGKRGGGGGRAKENRQDNAKLSYKNCFDTPHWNTLQRWGTEPALPTANRWLLDKYQLLFVVNLVKLHLTAYKLNLLMMPGPGTEPRPHNWKTCTLTTVPYLLPIKIFMNMTRVTWLFNDHFIAVLVQCRRCPVLVPSVHAHMVQERTLVF